MISLYISLSLIFILIVSINFLELNEKGENGDNYDYLIDDTD